MLSNKVLIKPGHRNLGLNLFYNESCPPFYEPKGFTSCINNDLCFPSGPMLVRKSTKASRFVTGAHRIGVIVSHVDAAEGEEQLKTIPEHVDYAIKRSRLDEFKVPRTDTTFHNLDLSSQSLPLVSQTSARNPMMASPAAPSTQTRYDLETKEALQGMQRSSSRPTDLMPTQSLVDAVNLDSEDSDSENQSTYNAILRSTLVPSPQQQMIAPTKMAELIVHARAIQQRCSRGDQVFVQTALNKFKIKRKATRNVVKCECMDESDSGDMARHCWKMTVRSC